LKPETARVLCIIAELVEAGHWCKVADVRARSGLGEEELTTELIRLARANCIILPSLLVQNDLLWLTIHGAAEARRLQGRGEA
jgi:hypothetical protein